MEGAAGREESGRRPAAADRLTMRLPGALLQAGTGSCIDWLFSSFEVQKALADIEDRLCARRLVGIEIDRPVFITALPRAGTTLLLETLDSLDLFATHTYRKHAVLCSFPSSGTPSRSPFAFPTSPSSAPMAMA